MASSKPSLRQLNLGLRCIRQASNGNRVATRLLSSSAAQREQAQVEATTPAQPPLPNPMETWGPLDPEKVDNKRDERRLMRRDNLYPVGSRRRRAALRTNAPEVPFEQMPYQAFQEARKFLLEDRQEKIKQIETQRARIANLAKQDASISGGEQGKEARLRSMRNYLNELIILADINDPMIKRKFEDGQGDMNKPIYRYLADKKWRKYKRLILEQRINQLHIVPDLLPAMDPSADVDLGFGRRDIAPGDFVDSRVSETMPRLKVQLFTPGEKLVTVVVVDADVPVLEKDSFTYRCHFLASNIPISPTQPSIPFNRMDVPPKGATDYAPKHIALPWMAPWVNRGTPYHRLAVFVLEQDGAHDIQKLAMTERQEFNLRSFVDRQKLNPIGVTLFRTKWDDNMAGVMRRAGLEEQVDIEFRRKRNEPLPYKRRTTERMRGSKGKM